MRKHVVRKLNKIRSVREYVRVFEQQKIKFIRLVIHYNTRPVNI